MSRVEERLSAIAEMVAIELGSTPEEVELWKELVRAVDVSRLERTGEIVVREADLDEAGEAEGVREHGEDHVHYDRAAVRSAMARLRATTYVAHAVSRRSGRTIEVPDLEEPNYDSADTELWLYGPLN